MTLLDFIQRTIAEFEEFVELLGKEFPSPVKAPFGDDYFHYRHNPKDRSDILASYLKMVRVANLLNACVELTKKGFVQEVYILSRSIDEANDDVLFWALPLGETGVSQDQKTLLADFYQDLMTDPNDPLAVSKRKSITRARIQEESSKAHGPEDAGRVQKIAKSIYRVFSGFVHGSYPSIMELYGHKFHLRGMLGTPRVAECISNLPNYVYRSLLSLEAIAARLGKRDLYDKIRAVSLNFANKTGCA